MDIKAEQRTRLASSFVYDEVVERVMLKRFIVEILLEERKMETKNRRGWGERERERERQREERERATYMRYNEIFFDVHESFNTHSSKFRELFSQVFQTFVQELVNSVAFLHLWIQ